MLDTTFGRLVGGIYDAVVDPELWSEAIDAIRREFRFHLAIMAVHKLPSGEAVVFAACNIPESYMRTFGDYAEDVVEVWGGLQAIARQPLRQPRMAGERAMLGPRQAQARTALLRQRDQRSRRGCGAKGDLGLVHRFTIPPQMAMPR